MCLRRALVVAGLISILLGPGIAAQQTQPPPSIEFGRAPVSLGMTREQVEKTLRESGRNLVDMNDGHTAVVRVNNAPVPTGDEGEVMFLMDTSLTRHFSFRRHATVRSYPRRLPAPWRICPQKFVR
jgi:hypothetical protein